MAKFSGRKGKKTKRKKARTKTSSGKRNNAWRQYVGGSVSNAPLPP
jgi:hypothetical protein